MLQEVPSGSAAHLREGSSMPSDGKGAPSAFRAAKVAAASFHPAVTTVTRFCAINRRVDEPRSMRGWASRAT
jgi:hypothetical protein